MGATVDIPGIRFFHMDNPEHRLALHNMLTSNTAPKSMAAARLIEYISSTCQTVILEEWYIDRDFADAYGKLYARGYQRHERFCNRLHLFSQTVLPEHVYDVHRQQLMQDAYLGYTVVLPALPQTLGRTVVRPPNDGRDFVLVKDKFPVNLVGFKLSVPGAPFIEQDQKVSACATAAIWMSTTAIGRRCGVPYYSTTEITELASRRVIGSGRAIPSEGLTIQQMLDALQSMGYDTVCFEDLDVRRARNIIYTHIESELPVILGIEFPLGRHALTVVGHSYDKDLPIQRSESVNPDWKEFASSWQPFISSLWVPSFIVNCDQRGFYQKLYLRQPTDMPPAFQGIFKDREKDPVKCGVELVVTPVPRGEPPELHAALRAIIVVLPKQVFLTGHQAETKSYGLILQAHKAIYGKPPPQDIVLRTYLISSNEFKASLSDTSLRPVAPCKSLVTAYRFKRFSRNVWVTEIGRFDKRAGKDCENLLIEGEVVLDASSSARSSEFICLHLRGKFMHMEPDEVDFSSAIDRLKENDQFVDNLVDDHDYSPLCRLPQH